MASLIDGLGLTLVFAAAGLVAILYYRTVPSIGELRARLPNRMTPAGIIASGLIIPAVWYLVASTDGFARIRTVIGLLFDLLIFETVFLLAMRWLKTNTLAVITALAIAVGAFLLQRTNPSTVVFNLTFILATFGASTLLVGMQFLRTRFLMLVAVLWTIYDILSNLFIFPKIYRVADRPHTSFLFPAIAVGQLTLGSGDIMFLVLFTLVLYRRFGLRRALVHVLVQALALLVTVMLKPTSVALPYLVVMTPLFFGVWLFPRRQHPMS